MTHSSLSLSFEFFPPKTPVAEEKLWEVTAQLVPFSPRFFSVTYGAGGTTREGTFKLVHAIQQKYSIPAASHLTCVGATRAEIQALAKHYVAQGITRIVALRGDAPGGMGKYVPHPEGYAYADDLVKGLLDIAPFEISVAAYPEVHPEAVSPEADLDHLQRKQAAGATRAIMQYCFDTTQILRFVERARRQGISMEMTPGVLPIYNIDQAISFSARCGASMPKWIIERFASVREDPEGTKAVSAEVMFEQCRALLQEGFSSVHFYTLNRAEVTKTVCERLRDAGV